MWQMDCRLLLTSVTMATVTMRYHGNMYDKYIIVGGQSSTALTIIFVDAGTKSCAIANKTDTNRVSTT